MNSCVASKLQRWIQFISPGSLIHFLPGLLGSPEYPFAHLNSINLILQRSQHKVKTKSAMSTSPENHLHNHAFHTVVSGNPAKKLLQLFPGNILSYATPSLDHHHFESNIFPSSNESWTYAIRWAFFFKLATSTTLFSFLDTAQTNVLLTNNSTLL